MMLEIARGKCRRIEEEIVKIWKQIKAESNEEIENLKRELKKAEEELSEQTKLFEVVEWDVRYYHMKMDLEKENLKPQSNHLSHARPSNSKPPSSILNWSKASI